MMTTSLPDVAENTPSLSMLATAGGAYPVPTRATADDCDEQRVAVTPSHAHTRVVMTHEWFLPVPGAE
jgi:hypothetical protein